MSEIPGIPIRQVPEIDKGMDGRGPGTAGTLAEGRMHLQGKGVRRMLGERRETPLEPRKVRGRKVEVHLAVVCGRLPENPFGCAVGPVKTRRDGKAFDFPYGGIHSGLIDQIPGESSEAGPIIKKLFEVLEHEGLSGLSYGAHLGRNPERVMNGAQRVAELPGQRLLGKLVIPAGDRVH